MMQALWKTITGTLVAMAGLVLMVPMDSQAMPTFARQTGMSCNSCHIGYSPTPNFTRTGRLFAMRGYVRPEVREKLLVEGNTVEDMPKYGGDYLALNWNNYFSGRFVSTFAQGGTSSAGVTMDTTSRPLSRFAMFYTGPVTDWLGLWTEIGYLGNNSLYSVTTGQAGPTGLNTFAYDEYRLSTGIDLGPGTFIGASLGNELANVVSQWNFPAGLPDQWNNKSGVGRFKEFMSLGVHGLFNDRYWAQVGFVTGDNDLNWSNGSNLYTALAYNVINKTRNDLWVVLETYSGTNLQSQMTSRKDSYICPGTCPTGVSDATMSITSNRGNGNILGAPVVVLKDFKSYKLRFEHAVADLGSHSWTASAVYNSMRENLVGGGSIERDVYGGLVRYYYNRTYGFQAQWQKDLKYDFTNAAGLKRGTYTKPTMSVTALWAPAMNVSVYVAYTPRVQNRVFADQENRYLGAGKSYNLAMEYSF